MEMGLFWWAGGMFWNKTVMTVPQPHKCPKNHRYAHFKWVNCPSVKLLKKAGRGKDTGQLPGQRTPSKAPCLG